MSGKLIVIEGPDGSGKQTQAEKLFDRLKNEGYKVRKITFPDYESNSSALVKMYLNGEFGSDPAQINPYAAATFYAVDRFASFCVAASWGEWYKEGSIIIADRYTTSNMAHQAVKIADESEREKFLEWLSDLEFVKFALPIPDIVIFLDVPPEYSQKLISQRNLKTSDITSQDIHEKNAGYLARTHESYLLASEKYGWVKINSAAKEGIRPVDDIHEEIYRIIKNKI
jgi:dTMP kinase